MLTTDDHRINHLIYHNGAIEMLGLDELFFGRRIRLKQDVIVCGGYDFKKKWGEEEKLAIVLRFFPGQSKTPALLVEFREPSSFVGYDAKYAILELRYANSQWREGTICYVEIFTTIPEEKPWHDRVHGPFVESHAVIKIANE